MERDQVLEAVEAEGAQASEILLSLDEADFDRPTRCRPWSVRALLAHLLVASNRLPTMLAGPRPRDATISAARYYRSDRRFGPDATTTRVAAATDDAASFASGHALAEAFDRAWREMLALAGAEPSGRVVRTRWDDDMSLSDFLVTRVVELAVHGLDLADGLDRRPWLTPAAAGVVAQLLVGDESIGSLPALGWDQLALIEAATGRRVVSEAESTLLAQHAVRWLTFG